MLRLLGPLELSAGGRELDLGGPRQRVVLAMLALNANRVVPVESLIDAVWDTAPPTTARAQVQICVSALRKIFLEADAGVRIKTRTPGYQLVVPAGELDTEQFGALVTAARTHADAGRTSEAVATLRTALGLWRGEALAGLQSDLVRRGADQLEHARLTAIMERIQLDLALGRHEEVVGELAALIEEHPLRERLYEFLMLALYRSGRQAEALEVGRRARTTLVEELGIEPGKALQELESSILNRIPELDLASTGTGPLRDTATTTTQSDKPLVVPRRLPASIADFTGREEQLAEIRRALSGEDDDRNTRFGMRIVAISGKGGVGKSTLAIRAAHELRDSYPDGHLYADLESPTGTNRIHGVLDRFLHALGVDGSAIPEDVEEKADMYRSRLADLRVLVVLDGAAGENDVIPLLPAGPGCAVIVTSRSPLSGLPGAALIAVSPFDVALSLEMLAKIIGPERMVAERAAAVELVDFCGRLPLAMRIAGARLASRPHWRLDVLVARLRNTTRRLDELTYHGLELRSSIGLTYRVLHDDAKALFRLFSLITTPDFPGWTAAALLDIDPFDAEEALEQLVETQLLDIVSYPGEHPRYRFHDLIRVYAQERLNEENSDADRHAAVVRLVGAWLAKAEEAHRKEYGGDHTILHGSGPRWYPDGDADGGMNDPLEWLESERRSLVGAVHLAASVGEDELCWDLALTAVTLFEVKGHFDSWRETSEAALEVAERAGNRRGQAAMLYSLGSLAMSQRRFTAAEERFAAALEIFRAESDQHGCALVLRNAAMVDRCRGRSGAMLAKYHESLTLMREVDDPVGEAGILRSLAKLRIDEGNTDDARELLGKALECTRRVRYLRGEAQIVIRYAELHLGQNQVGEAHQALNRVLLIVRNIGDRIGEAHALYGVGVVRLRTGRLDNAKTTLEHAHSLARRVGERLIEAQALYALGEIALARGNSTTGLEHLAEAKQLFAELGSTVWHAKTLILISDVHQGAGDLDRAREEIQLATELLDGIDSKEAGRLQQELAAVRAALLDEVVDSVP
ncbi:AfsR/SARP family transcriptional regulator [Actinophytocola glycyrrhizae]|uniref:BTAD domain-containing putative transcriptional regulator n=1 Tax=Actinophytocola glycyrrhizae TaxID=2044873 RepID=A0ABV9S884_9PSEU